MTATAGRALGPLLFVWLGMMVGISLLAAPVPFMVEALDRAEALVVNRQLFRMLTFAEQGLLTLLLIVAFAARTSTVRWLGILTVGAIVLVQGFVLLPELARRTDVVLAGGEPEEGPYHTIYVSLEFAKMILLAGLGSWFMRGAGSRSVDTPGR